MVVLVALPFFSGCLYAPDLDDIRVEIERQLPGASFDREFAISLGPGSLGLAKMIVRFIPDGHEARRYLRDVSHVKLAVYNADGIPPDAKLEVPSQMAELLEDQGWQLAARVNDHDENVWMLCRVENDEIHELFLVVLSDDELVMVRARGRLDRLAQEAMHEHGNG